MGRRRPAWLLGVAALLAGGPVATPGEEAPPLYRLVGGFGPAGVAFPWHAAFSPDGRWVGFSDGHTGYVEVWDVASGKRAWPSDRTGDRGTHRVAFAADSTRMAFVSRGRLRLLTLDGGAWRDARAVPLGVDPEISARWSPLRLALAPDASSAVLAAQGRAFRVDVAAGRVEPLSGDADDVIATFLLPGGEVAYSRSRAFTTRVVGKDGAARDVPGVLLETSPDGKRWLVATDAARFDLGFLAEDADSRLALEIREAGGATLGAFALSGRRKPGDGSGHRLLLQGAFSPDGRLLATVEGPGDIVLRDARTGAPLQRVREYAAQPYPMGVAFSPDGASLLTGGRRKDGPEVLVWSRAAR